MPQKNKIRSLFIFCKFKHVMVKNVQFRLNKTIQIG